MAKRKIISKTSFVDKDKVGRRKPAGTPLVIHQKTVKAEWDCNSCGRSNIPGDTKSCPSCDHTKDQTEAYRSPGYHSPALSKEEMHEMGVDENHYSDQECEYCGRKSQPGTEWCPGCNASLLDVARTGRKCPSCDHETNESTCPNCYAATKSKKESFTIYPETQKKQTYKVPLKRINYGGSSFDFPIQGALIAAGIVAFIAMIAFIFWPRHAEVQVDSVRWQSTISLQEYQYNDHEGWSLPSAAEEVRTSSEIHHYDQVADGTETEHYSENVCENVYSHTTETCYDDGSCDYDDVYESECHSESRTREVTKYKDVAVYDDYYKYMIWEWARISPAVTSGVNYEPYWSTNYTIDSTHRENGRKTEFSVLLIDRENGDDFTYRPNTLSQFQQYRHNSMWDITHSGGNITEIERIER